MKPIRCIVCRTEFTDEEIKGNQGCPICGYRGLTMFTDGDINIDINWFELRLLCMWAEALALQVGDKHSLNAFYSMVNEIKEQLPECGKITMFNKPPHEEINKNDGMEESNELPPEDAIIN
ncbi:MAG: hypothetical protein DRI84_07440 [Bacteroidetes bacterium]|nr:MAG: hypothetical protein DRI84_07440 [Bacteroidota bacterium]